MSSTGHILAGGCGGTVVYKNPNVIDVQKGEYLMDIINTINALPEAEKPTAENPITINFFNHSKTIDWSRWNGLIHVPRFVAINFVGNIDWWSNDYYLSFGFENGLLENNPTYKFLLGFSFSRANDNARVFVSGLPLNLNKIFFGGLDQSYQIAGSYQDLIDNPENFGESGFNLVRVDGSKEDDIRNDALYKKVNGVFVDITPDFRNCDFIGASLIGAYLFSANLQYANLQNANLQYANLQYANLQNANLQNANLQNANLQNANLYNANMENANLYNAILQYANLGYTDLQNAYLGYADLQNAYLGNANLSNANFQNANLQNVGFGNANLQNANLTGCTNLPESINTKALFIAECGAANVNAETIWIDGTSILS